MQKKLSGQEKFQGSNSESIGFVHDFWSWAFSDLNSNVIRGAIAEYIVAAAMGVQSNSIRNTWAPVDLQVSNIKIEVKASGYVQSWYQKSLSKPSFGYPATRPWDESTNTLGPQKVRSADVYVFCLLTTTSRELVDPLNLDQWDFFVVATKTLNERERSQTSITLASLEKITTAVKFAHLKAAIVKAAVQVGTVL